MAHRFKVGEKYSGEVMFGGCGQMDTHIHTVVKRTKGWIYYQEKHGRVIRTRRKYLAKWGEYYTTGYDQFFAYAIEGK